MTEQQQIHAGRPCRCPVATRISREAMDEVERLARERRTTPSHIVRVLVEDGVEVQRALGE